MERILILGATSAIALECARLWARPGANFYLVARNSERLATVQADLEARGAQVRTEPLDLDELEAHVPMLERCFEQLGHPDLCLLAHGVLPDQEEAKRSAAVSAACLHTNTTSPIALLTELGERLAARGQGQLAVISSVAGDRGRPSNYPYGANKAALTAFCDGQRGRLFKRGVHLLLIKPGFVDTPMTEGLPMAPPLRATPQRVAADIDRAVQRRANTLYTPWFWGPIMLVIRLLPAWVLKRLEL